ncbi:unnamed protein product, partial [Trichobilharzia regenti]
MTNKDSQHRKPLLVNQGVSFESYSHPSHSNANANTAQGGTLSHLSNTVSTAAVQ